MQCSTFSYNYGTRFLILEIKLEFSLYECKNIINIIQVSHILYNPFSCIAGCLIHYLSNNFINRYVILKITSFKF